MYGKIGDLKMSDRPVYGPWDVYENETRRMYQAERKAWHVTDVEIILETTGITPEDVQKMPECFENNIDFALHNDKTFILVYPELNALTIGESHVILKDTKQLLNQIKLILFTHNKVFIPNAGLLP